jgi:hypothetical protein
MIRLLKYLGLITALVVAAAAAVHFTGNTPRVVVFLLKPHHGWDLSKKAPQPDYESETNWAALPGRDSLAKSAPPGEPVAEGDVDVFFVHPTGYLHGGDWNSPMDPDTKTEENLKWMMANQASVFSSCCRIFAPRYREASIYRYLAAPPEIAGPAMDFAYADVVRAFENFIATRNQDRPFILAGHSQGTTHGMRLLAEKIDGTPLADRMVAAYLIGSRVTNAEAAALKQVKVCDSAEQTGCLVHYAAFGEGAEPGPDYRNLVCVNPLSWRRDGDLTPKDKHRGAVAPSGRFQFPFFSDRATGVEFGPLGKPIPGLTSAVCKDGLLILDDMRQTPLARLIIQEWNYHGLDYPAFHMDLRENIRVRIEAYKANAQVAP